MQTGQDGEFIFVVKPDDTVEARPISAGITYDGQRIITSGLKPGETVVTDGQVKLTAGAKVSVKSDADDQRTRGNTGMKKAKHPTFNIRTSNIQ